MIEYKGKTLLNNVLVTRYFKQISGNELVDNLYEQVESLGGVIEFDKALKIENGKV